MNTRDELEIRRQQVIAILSYLVADSWREEDVPPKLHGSIVRVVDHLNPDNWNDLLHAMAQCHIAGQLDK